MEFKEHLVALVLMLAFYLPIVVFRGNLPVDRESRLMAAVVSGLIVLPAPRISTPVASFAVSYSIAAIVVGFADALKVLIPGLEEGAEQTLGPAWLTWACWA